MKRFLRIFELSKNEQRVGLDCDLCSDRDRLRRIRAPRQSLSGSTNLRNGSETVSESCAVEE